MTRNWHNPDRAPTPAELAAWADGELDHIDAGRIEAYLADHPDAVVETDAMRRVTRLYTEHAPPEPSPDAWNATLDRIALSAQPLAHPTQPRQPRLWTRILIVALTAAAVISGVLVAGRFLPTPATPEKNLLPDLVRVSLPKEDDNDLPFAVAEPGEINIISMEADDANRVLMGQPLFDTFEVATPDDINVVGVEPNWEEGNMPRLQRGERVPMVVVARADREQ